MRISGERRARSSTLYRRALGEDRAALAIFQLHRHVGGLLSRGKAAQPRGLAAHHVERREKSTFAPGREGKSENERGGAAVCFDPSEIYSLEIFLEISSSAFSSPADPPLGIHPFPRCAMYRHYPAHAITYLYSIFYNRYRGWDRADGGGFAGSN